jgi:hypothetical protein
LQAVSRAGVYYLQCSYFCGSKLLLHVVAVTFERNLSYSLYTQEILKWKVVAIYRLISLLILLHYIKMIKCILLSYCYLFDLVLASVTDLLTVHGLVKVSYVMPVVVLCFIQKTST